MHGRRARPTPAAGDASDERPVARCLADTPCIRPPEDERAGRRDPGIDGAAEPPGELDGDRGLAGAGINASDDAPRADEPPARRGSDAAGRRNGDPGAGDGNADEEPVALVRGASVGYTHTERRCHGDGCQRDPDHGTLRNQRAERAPPARRSRIDPARRRR